MAASRFLNILTVSALIVFVSALAAIPANANAMTTPQVKSLQDISTRYVRGHDAIAKRKRETKKCKDRPTSPAQCDEDKSHKGDQADSEKPEGSHTSSKSKSDVNKAGINWFENSDLLSKWKPADGHEGWFYNWTPEFSGKHGGWDFVPMIWGYKFANDQWFDHVATSGSKYVLSINEPDQDGQANMDVGAGIKLYKKYISPLKGQGYKLGLPATSSGPAGFDWVVQFVDQCGEECPYDFAPLHYYDVTVDGFKKYVNKWHERFGTVWVTEFACQNFNGGAQCDEGQIWDFMHSVTSWMDSQDWVERYCAFGSMADMTNVNALNRLMDIKTKGPNDLGSFYIGLHV